MSNAADWRCHKCGCQLVDADEDCPICTPKERREKRLKELWAFVYSICGRRGESDYTECWHPEGESECSRSDCPAMPMAEKVMERLIKDIR